VTHQDRLPLPALLALAMAAFITILTEALPAGSVASDGAKPDGIRGLGRPTRHHLRDWLTACRDPIDGGHAELAASAIVADRHQRLSLLSMR
jgi:hypothetical protein